MKIGPYTITRGSLTPYVAEGRTSQVTKVAGDGSVTVIEQLHDAEEFMRAKIRVPKAEAETIKAFLEALGFARDTTTIEDGFGTVFTVRFWDRRVRIRHVGNELGEMDLLFREEIA